MGRGGQHISLGTIGEHEDVIHRSTAGESGEGLGTKFELNPLATVCAREVKLEPGGTPTSGVI
jgi:hypothetical protein